MNKMLKPAVAVVAASCVLTVIACGSSGGDGPTDDPGASSSGTSGETSSGTTTSSSGFGSSGTTSGASSGDPKECAAQEAAATLAKKPVDIIIAIDNSGSMSGEIAEVEKQINDNFSTIIDAAKIDYHVIMVTQYGLNSNQDVCIKAPLAPATTCTGINTNVAPVESAKFFHHAVQVESTDAFCRLNEFWNKADRFGKHPGGWSSLLRPNAFKVFLVVTDDRVNCTFGGKTYNDSASVAGGDAAGKQFDTDLLALSPTHFGTAAKRNYVWHSIIALAPFNNADLTQAHPASAPIVTATCTPGAAAIGTGYQGLSKVTGGLRYPTCGLNYTTIFKEMAKSVISGATVACEFPVPTAPAGESLDLSTVVPRYTPGGGGASTDFQQVANAAACAPDKFYIENNIVKLCPQTCDKVQLDPTAAIKVLFGCKPKGAN